MTAAAVSHGAQSSVAGRKFQGSRGSFSFPRVGGKGSSLLNNTEVKGPEQDGRQRFLVERLGVRTSGPPPTGDSTSAGPGRPISLGSPGTDSDHLLGRFLSCGQLLVRESARGPGGMRQGYGAS